jgi:homospermidine synthase
MCIRVKKLTQGNKNTRVKIWIPGRGVVYSRVIKNKGYAHSRIFKFK